MHLIDGNRLIQYVGLGPPRHPLCVLPGVFAEIGDDRRCARPKFGGKRIGVNLLIEMALLGLDLEL